MMKNYQSAELIELHEARANLISGGPFRDGVRTDALQACIVSERMLRVRFIQVFDDGLETVRVITYTGAYTVWWSTTLGETAAHTAANERALKRRLYRLLPDVFSAANLGDLAEQSGMLNPFFYQWIKEWIEHGLLEEREGSTLAKPADASLAEDHP